MSNHGKYRPRPYEFAGDGVAFIRAADSGEPASILRPIFDSVWQSAGFNGSFNYNKDGKWCPQH
jgi:hypothetical protein